MTQPCLIDETRGRLEQHRGQFAHIARRYGLKYSWLTKFAQGTVLNPTFRHLEALRCALDRLDLDSAEDPNTRTKDKAHVR